MTYFNQNKTTIKDSIVMSKKETEKDIMTSRYELAKNLEKESFLTKKIALNATIYPKWLSNSDSFVFELETQYGKEYRLVNAEAASVSKAFDHHQLAEALALAANKEVDEKNLPIDQVSVNPSQNVVQFHAFEKRWKFFTDKCSCEEIELVPPNFLVSPDRKKAVFTRDYNLWIKDFKSGSEYALTKDGDQYYSYGTMPEKADLAGAFSPPPPYPQIPSGLWSPDSKKFLTMITDERKVQSFPVNCYVPKSGSIRPQAWQPRYALPGDKNIVQYRLLTMDVGARTAVNAEYSPILDTGVMPGPFMRNRVWWSNDSLTAYFVDMSRYEKKATVVELNTQEGTTRELFYELSDTFIDLNLMNEEPCTFLPLPNTNELVWYSERSGWAHLYLYDLVSGDLKRPLTEGQWLVRELVGYDVDRRDVYVQVAGRVANRDPYYREICRINIDTGIMTSLASSDHDYVIHKPGSATPQFASLFGRDANDACGLSPSGNYLVVTRTRVDEVPVTELRDREGKIIMEVVAADISNLPGNWHWPEPVKLVAADGKTDIYGVIFRPSHFDPNEAYPVIDYTIGLPILPTVPKGAFMGANDINASLSYLSAAAWAELGFIVVVIDGRGTTCRNKSFHDECYGQIHTADNLEDHIAGIRQLTEIYPYMDIDRVGITGPGGCNAPVYGMLAFPKFYKVGVASSVFDIRLASGLETYRGPRDESNFADSIMGNLAKNLQGRLLLIHGMLDNYFSPAGTFQLVDCFVRENKRFDMLLLPNGGHMLREGYQLCRAWDYMVEHLKGIHPPHEFSLKAGYENALEQ